MALGEYGEKARKAALAQKAKLDAAAAAGMLGGKSSEQVAGLVGEAVSETADGPWNKIMIFFSALFTWIGQLFQGGSKSLGDIMTETGANWAADATKKKLLDNGVNPEAAKIIADRVHDGAVAERDPTFFQRNPGSQRVTAPSTGGPTGGPGNGSTVALSGRPEQDVPATLKAMFNGQKGQLNLATGLGDRIPFTEAQFQRLETIWVKVGTELAKRNPPLNQAEFTEEMTRRLTAEVAKDQELKAKFNPLLRSELFVSGFKEGLSAGYESIMAAANGRGVVATAGGQSSQPAGVPRETVKAQIKDRLIKGDEAGGTPSLENAFQKDTQKSLDEKRQSMWRINPLRLGVPNTPDDAVRRGYAPNEPQRKIIFDVIGDNSADVLTDVKDPRVLQIFETLEDRYKKLKTETDPQRKEALARDIGANKEALVEIAGQRLDQALTKRAAEIDSRSNSATMNPFKTVDYFLMNYVDSDTGKTNQQRIVDGYKKKASEEISDAQMEAIIAARNSIQNQRDIVELRKLDIASYGQIKNGEITKNNVKTILKALDDNDDGIVSPQELARASQHGVGGVRLDTDFQKRLKEVSEGLQGQGVLVKSDASGNLTIQLQAGGPVARTPAPDGVTGPRT